MFHVTIRDYVMIAHSLPAPAFGPAQQLHGATYVIDASFRRENLDQNQIVIDIALAHEVLKKVLAPLNYQNLDELPQFQGKLTTTEYLAFYVHQELGKALAGQFQGELEVRLGESHVAWAGYSGPVE